MLPEIADYELRRKLHHLMRKNPRVRTGLDRLDPLAATLRYVPLSMSVMRMAAELWGEARAAGQPTAGDTELDGDVILAAQALAVDGTVVTTNPRHLGRFVAVKDWETIGTEYP